MPDDRRHEEIWRWQLEHTPTLKRPWPWVMLARQRTKERAEEVRIHFASQVDSDECDIWWPLRVCHESEGVPPLPEELTEPPAHLTELVDLMRLVARAEQTRRDRE